LSYLGSAAGVATVRTFVVTAVAAAVAQQQQQQSWAASTAVHERSGQQPAKGLEQPVSIAVTLRMRGPAYRELGYRGRRRGSAY